LIAAVAASAAACGGGGQGEVCGSSDRALGSTACEVVTVTPDTPLKDVAAILAERKIAGVPVCGRRPRLRGRSPLERARSIRKRRPDRLDPQPRRSVGREDRGPHRGRRDELAGGDDLSRGRVAEAAKLMIGNRISRLPVVEKGQLVGIVARADLIRAFQRSDEEVASEIEDDVLLRTLWVDPETVAVSVAGGQVALAGKVENRTTAELIEVLHPPGPRRRRRSLGAHLGAPIARPTRGHRLTDRKGGWTVNSSLPPDASAAAADRSVRPVAPRRSSIYDRVVVGVDGSEPGFEACRQAARLVTPGGWLEVFSAVELAAAVHTGFSAPRIRAELVDDATEAICKGVEIAVESAASRLVNGPEPR
jgi:CBS domain-containing protein